MKKIRNYLKQENGSVIILVVLFVVVLIGFTGLVIDGGRMFYEKSNLQKAVDAAVLAGAQNLPDDEINAKAIARTIAEENLQDTDVTIDVEIDIDHSAIRVTANKNLDLTLARILNHNQADISATAKVVVYPLNSYSGRGIVPIGINFAHYPELETLEEGNLVELKWGDSETGNFGALAIDGAGADNFMETLLHGTDREISVGDIIDTETGDMAGPTEQGLEGTNNPNDELGRYESCEWDPAEETALEHTNTNPGCPRIVITPIYEPYGDDGKQVKIVGFASMFIVEVRSTGNDKGVDAIFLERTVLGDSDPEQQNLGTYGYKLVE